MKSRCKSICLSVTVEKTKYSSSKWCGYCTVWLPKEYDRCICCGQILRTKSRRKTQWYKTQLNKKITYKNKPIWIGTEIRKNKCSECGKKPGDEYTDWRGRTKIIRHMTMHHLEYHDDDPLKDTIELCPSCHGKKQKRLR